MILLYTLFLRMQVGPHSYFFSYSYPERRSVRARVPIRLKSTQNRSI